MRARTFKLSEGGRASWIVDNCANDTTSRQKGACGMPLLSSTAASLVLSSWCSKNVMFAGRLTIGRRLVRTGSGAVSTIVEVGGEVAPNFHPVAASVWQLLPSYTVAVTGQGAEPWRSHGEAFPAQEDEQTPIAEAALPCQRAQPFPQAHIVPTP
jgi:hypothetical protein